VGGVLKRDEKISRVDLQKTKMKSRDRDSFSERREEREEDQKARREKEDGRQSLAALTLCRSLPEALGFQGTKTRAPDFSAQARSPPLMTKEERVTKGRNALS